MIRRWGSKHLGNIEQFLRGMSGARLRRVCHEANILESQVAAWITVHGLKDSEVINVRANNSEIMFDSTLVGPFRFRVAKPRKVAGNVASLRMAFRGLIVLGRITIAGMDNLPEKS